jgi:glyoxalase-like protein
MRIDHVIRAVDDLDEAATWLEAEHGLRATGGGRHEGIGTHNRIAPLGGGYLELIAVADAEEAARSELGRVLAAAIERASGNWLAWCVAVDDIQPVAERLETTRSEIAREGLSAQLTAVAEAMAEPCLPFFIERDAGVADPGAEGDAGGIDWVELSGDRARLEQWLGGTDLPVRMVDGPPELRAVSIGGRLLG